MANYGKVDFEKLAATLFTTGKRPLFPALRQAAENSIDAGATSIQIEIIDRGKPEGYILITDDGGGFGDKDLQAFHSVYRSSKEGQLGVIGKHGSGRLLLLGIAREITVYTRSAEFPKLSRVSLTREDVVTLLRDKLKWEREEVRKPRWIDIGRTGTVLVLADIDWKKVPTNKDIVAKFADYLKPSIARCITVNGKRLSPRAVIGEVIQERITVPYLPGEQEVELFIPSVRKPGDKVMIGGYNQICAVDELYSQLNTFDASMVPVMLLDRSICGAIFIPALNEFRGHTSDALESGFFDPEGLDIRNSVLRFLNEEVGELISKAFRRKSQKEESEMRAQMLAGIAGRFNPAFDFDPQTVRSGGRLPGKASESEKGKGGKSRSSGMAVNTRYVQLTPGETFNFRVTRTAGTSGRFTWDDSACGGELSAKSGTEVIYTAGDELSPKDDPYELVVYDRRKRSNSVVIYIYIVKKVPVTVTPLAVEIERGSHHRFQIRNLHLTSGDIEWSIAEDAKGLSLGRTEAPSTEVMVSDKAPLGKYTLVAYDRGKKKKYTAAFEVIEKPFEAGAFMKIEDVVYCIEGAPNIQMVVERVKGGSLLTQKGRSKRVDLLRIGFNHPLLRNLQRSLSSSSKVAAAEVYMQKVAQYIILAHLRGLAEDGNESFNELTFVSRLLRLEQQVQDALLEHQAKKG